MDVGLATPALTEQFAIGPASKGANTKAARVVASTGFPERISGWVDIRPANRSPHLYGGVSLSPANCWPAGCFSHVLCRYSIAEHRLRDYPLNIDVRRYC